jgi:hypothetical protein
MRWLLGLLFVLGLVGIAMGVGGIIIESGARRVATIDVRGISPWIFEELVSGSVMLCTYVGAVALLRSKVKPAPPGLPSQAFGSPGRQ